MSILDLAAGTGLLGAEIGRHGYVNVDGLDCSLGMLGKARSQVVPQIDKIIGEVGH